MQGIRSHVCEQKTLFHVMSDTDSINSQVKKILNQYHVEVEVYLYSTLSLIIMSSENTHTQNIIE